MPIYYQPPVTDDGTPKLIGTVVTVSNAWDARLVLTAGTVWQSAFDAFWLTADQIGTTFDAIVKAFSGRELAFDALVSIVSQSKFDAQFSYFDTVLFDARFFAGDSRRFDAAFGIGSASGAVFDARLNNWTLGSLVSVYGYFLKPDGTPLSGIGTLRISAPARLLGTAVMPAPIHVPVASNGFFSVQLYANADLRPSTTVYLFTLDKWTLVFRVPRVGSVWLHQLEHLRLADPIFFETVMTEMTREGAKTYIVVRIGTKIYKLPAEPWR